MENNINSGEYDIFISYRRNGGEYIAQIIHDRLIEKGYKVFLDIEALRAGNFNTALYSVIDKCSNFLMILSEGALDRCVDENDWVRRELEYALMKEKTVIPIMLRGFKFPEELPESIESVRLQQGISASTEYFDAFIDRLCTYLETKSKSEEPKQEKGYSEIAPTIKVPLWKKILLWMKKYKIVFLICILLIVGIVAAANVDFNKEWESNILMSDKVEMGEDGLKVLGSKIDRAEILNVTFLDTLKDMPNWAWDVSEKNDGSVMAWKVQNGGYYDLYIGAEGGINAANACETLFSDYTNVKSIKFNNAFHTDYATLMTGMFYDCWSLNELDVSGFVTDNVTNMRAMFSACRSLNEIDVSGFNTENVNNMSAMFADCIEITELDTDSFDTSKVSYIKSMFYNCCALKKINVSSFDTSKVISFEKMFMNCSSLKSIDVSSFNTAYAIDMSYMFAGCKLLESLDLSGFNMANVQKMDYTFSNCTSLEYIDGLDILAKGEKIFDNCYKLRRIGSVEFEY